MSSPTLTSAIKRASRPKLVVDQPGEFAMINKHDLLVDQSYQRKHYQEKIKTMAEEWSWVACGAISVALRESKRNPSGLEWYVMDGQHRVLASLECPEITDLPCMCFHVNSIVDEAQGFLKTNTARKAMSMVDRFKALLMTNDPAALVANELLQYAGRHVASGGAGHTTKGFSAVHSLLTCIKNDEPAMRRVWPTIAELCKDTQIKQTIVQAFWYLEQNLEGGTSLSQKHWRQRAVQVGIQAIEDAINVASNYHGGGKGFKNCGLGLQNALNRGLRNRLPSKISTTSASEAPLPNG